MSLWTGSIDCSLGGEIAPGLPALLEDVDSSDEDEDSDPVSHSRILRRPVWPSHYDVPSSSGDLLARYRSKDSQPNASNSGTGEGFRTLLDTGSVPQRQFVMVEQRAKAAEAMCKQQERQLNTLDIQVADLTLSNQILEKENSILKTQIGRAEAELVETKLKLVIAEAKLKEQGKAMEDLDRKHNNALEDNKIFKQRNRVLESQLKRETKRKATDELGGQPRRAAPTGLKGHMNPPPAFSIPSGRIISPNPFVFC
ncbi:hypothetical protein RhiJN_07561 [Ceratobasidium sp. AG-Ba]|nr:hypothetical protein RhiJN_07561 [Ceratobasidium sp. AG-Ba]QRW08407.1 hypothetical protein RhiLY_07406 [Ceratobasidium sp. AG-Ba]